MTPGSNIPLSAARVTVDVAAPVRLDVSGLLLTADGKVRSDDDFIFYNQPTGPGVTYRSGGGTAPDAIVVDTAAVRRASRRSSSPPARTRPGRPSRASNRPPPSATRTTTPSSPPSRPRSSAPRPRWSSWRSTCATAPGRPRGGPGLCERPGRHRHRLRRHRGGAGPPAGRPGPARRARPARAPGAVVRGLSAAARRRAVHARRSPAAPAAPPAPAPGTGKINLDKGG